MTIETPGLANKIYIGLAVTSHTADVLAGATFSGVATTGTVSSQWTVAAIGDTDQAEGDNGLDKLYVALEDSTGTRKKVYAPETAVGTARWTEWVIPYSDFAGVNMSKIKFMAIGIGDTANPLNGEGLVYIDNIGIGHALGE